MNGPNTAWVTGGESPLPRSPWCLVHSCQGRVIDKQKSCHLCITHMLTLDYCISFLWGQAGIYTKIRYWGTGDNQNTLVNMERLVALKPRSDCAKREVLPVELEVLGTAVWRWTTSNGTGPDSNPGICILRLESTRFQNIPVSD